MSTDNQYAERDAMWLDQQGGHYIRHVDHMTREGLHSKSDIAAELGWRDLQIHELTQQLAAKIISEQNIINAFGISGEGAHSKLVIEYVHGLVAEKSRIAAEASMLKEVNADIMRSVYRAKTHMDSGKAVEAERALQCAIGRKSGSTEDTDAAIAEIGAKAIDMFAAWQKDLALQSQGDIRHAYVGSVHDANRFAANLRAGRKG